jgi:hypothetical protein
MVRGIAVLGLVFWGNGVCVDPSADQGRRPPRIARPSAGTAIWLRVCVTGRSDVFGCHKVAGTKVGSPHHGPTMRGFAFHSERQLLRRKPQT